MNEQQLAAVKLALEALESPAYGSELYELQDNAKTALRSIISQDALDKKADNARELGLDYEPAVIQQMVDALDHADELLGGNDTLVMNGAAAGRWLLEQPAVQEPVGVYGHCPICGAKGVTRERRPDGDDRCANGHTYKSMHATTPPAPQPVPVKTYHDGKPWPVAPKPWVGLTDEEIEAIPLRQPNGFAGFARAVEAKLKEKNT